MVNKPDGAKELFLKLKPICLSLLDQRKKNVELLPLLQEMCRILRGLDDSSAGDTLSYFTFPILELLAKNTCGSLLTEPLLEILSLLKIEKLGMAIQRQILSLLKKLIAENHGHEELIKLALEALRQLISPITERGIESDVALLLFMELDIIEKNNFVGVKVESIAAITLTIQKIKNDLLVSKFAPGILSGAVNKVISGKSGHSKLIKNAVELLRVCTLRLLAPFSALTEDELDADERAKTLRLNLPKVFQTLFSFVSNNTCKAFVLDEIRVFCESLLLDKFMIILKEGFIPVLDTNYLCCGLGAAESKVRLMDDSSTSVLLIIQNTLMEKLKCYNPFYSTEQAARILVGYLELLHNKTDNVLNYSDAALDIFNEIILKGSSTILPLHNEELLKFFGKSLDSNSALIQKALDSIVFNKDHIFNCVNYLLEGLILKDSEYASVFFYKYLMKIDGLVSSDQTVLVSRCCVEGIELFIRKCTRSRDLEMIQQELECLLINLLFLIASGVHSQTCLKTLKCIASKLQYKDTDNLIIQNSDYLINAMIIKIRYESHDYAKFLLIINELVKLCGVKILPYLDDIFELIMKEVHTSHVFHYSAKHVILLLDSFLSLATTIYDSRAENPLIQNENEDAVDQTKVDDGNEEDHEQEDEEEKKAIPKSMEEHILVKMADCIKNFVNMNDLFIKVKACNALTKVIAAFMRIECVEENGENQISKTLVMFNGAFPQILSQLESAQNYGLVLEYMKLFKTLICEHKEVKDFLSRQIKHVCEKAVIPYFKTNPRDRNLRIMNEYKAFVILSLENGLIRDEKIRKSVGLLLDS
ncbi:hypothetical protein MP638_005728 [Amoeboaphelidium occidentale]|nr:hypothetical protein MP638_005728 [Amoeboaphelidium occidentale]